MKQRAGEKDLSSLQVSWSDKHNRMKIDSQKYHRRSMRLKGYDYSLPGAYFITLVTYHREYLFGEMVGGEMRLNRNGNIVERVWTNLPNHYPQITLEAFVVMPNHVHGIVIIHEGDDDYGRGGSETRPYEWGAIKRDRMMCHGLPEIVRAFKSFSARRINQLQHMQGVAIWQRSFYDHIIRGDQDLQNIWEYIQTNPQKWQEDQFHFCTMDNPIKL